MEVLVGKNSGFCFGVKHTIIRTNQVLKESKYGIDCLGELIHNKQVVQDLESKGLRSIDSIKDAKSDKVIIRAHGTTKNIYDYAKEQGIELIDLTCPKVARIHEQVEKYKNDGYFIFLFGIKNHPETIRNIQFLW